MMRGCYGSSAEIGNSEKRKPETQNRRRKVEDLGEGEVSAGLGREGRE